MHICCIVLSGIPNLALGEVSTREAADTLPLVYLVNVTGTLLQVFCV